MSGLMIKYSEEVASALTKIPVVLPGSPVSVGDILYFKEGEPSWVTRLLVDPKPIGSFEKITDLKSLGVTASIVEDDPSSADSYVFSSKNGTSVAFEAGGEASDPRGDTGQGSLKVTFSSEGAVYFSAVDCTTERVDDLSAIQVNLQEHNRTIVWHDTFIVTSVTTAKRALIMQSSSNSALLSVKGDVNGLLPGSATGSASANVLISGYKDASFIKPWSSNVTVFIGLHRFKKTDFGSLTKALAPGAREKTSRLLNLSDDNYTLEEVSPNEILVG